MYCVFLRIVSYCQLLYCTLILIREVFSNGDMLYNYWYECCKGYENLSHNVCKRFCRIEFEIQQAAWEVFVVEYIIVLIHPTSSKNSDVLFKSGYCLLLIVYCTCRLKFEHAVQTCCIIVTQAVATPAAWFSERLDGAWAAVSPLRSATYFQHAGANQIVTRVPDHCPARCCRQPSGRPYCLRSQVSCLLARFLLKNVIRLFSYFRRSL